MSFEESSRLALDEAAGQVGVDPAGAEIIRLGTCAVYRLKCDVVARVGRSQAVLPVAAHEIALARWLERDGISAARVIDVDQPVVVAGHVVTFWVEVSGGGHHGTSAHVAEALRDFHRIEPPPDVRLRPHDPFATATAWLDEARGLDRPDGDFLRQRLDELRVAWDVLEFELPQGVIHGDPCPGNVLRDAASRPVLIDLDGISYGPREWDLGLTATYYDSMGWHTRQEYDEFVDIYGYDVTAWSGFATVRAIHEMLQVSWLSTKITDGPVAAAEFALRVGTLRDGSSRRSWTPF